MSKLKDMSADDLEHFIESKLLEILGDPDVDLQLKDNFKKKLQSRMKKPSKRISYEEVLKKIYLKLNGGKES